jgi:hypothetical protein
MQLLINVSDGSHATCMALITNIIQQQKLPSRGKLQWLQHKHYPAYIVYGLHKIRKRVMDRLMEWHCVWIRPQCWPGTETTGANLIR